MAGRSSVPRLTDIVDACARLRALLAGVSLDAYQQDWQRQWMVERGVEIVSEASRHLPEELKARHPGIPWRKVAGIGNVLRHEYTRVAAPLMWALVQDHLPALEDACRAELAAEPPGGIPAS